MARHGVRLQYRFGDGTQHGAEIENPLFELLSALAAAGSIQHAAGALGVSYRHLWGSLKAWEKALGEPLVQWVRGQPARLTPFAERLLWSERAARVRMAPHIEALRRELQHVLDDAFDVTQHVLRIDASHDLALPALQAQAVSRQRLHLQLRFAGSMDALLSLAQGRCSVAGFHVPALAGRDHVYAKALKPLLAPGRHKLIGCMRRRQGLMVAPGNPLAVASIADVARARLRFASREPGAGTYLLGQHLLREAGLAADALDVVAVENSHVAVAHRVARGDADAALGLQAAAVAEGLGFVPLLEEDYYLACLSETLEQPAMRALRELLADPAWLAELSARAGYAPSPQAGQVLSLTRALPWWRFSAPRTAAGSRTRTARSGESAAPR